MIERLYLKDYTVIKDNFSTSQMTYTTYFTGGLNQCSYAHCILHCIVLCGIAVDCVIPYYIALYHLYCIAVFHIVSQRITLGK